MKKKIRKISVALVLVLAMSVLSVFTGFAKIEVKEYIPGDVNGDYFVNISDATLIQKDIAQLEALASVPKTAADFDGNNSVDVIDATEIQKMIVEMDYNCGVKPIDSYKSIEVERVSENTFENIIDSSKLGYFGTYFQARKLNVSGYYLISSVDEYYDLFGYCRQEYNNEFFENNALVLWTAYHPENDVAIQYNPKFTKIAVDNGVLKIQHTDYEPGYENPIMQCPNYNLNLFYKVNKEDVKDVTKIQVNSTVEWSY